MFFLKHKNQSRNAGPNNKKMTIYKFQSLNRIELFEIESWNLFVS